MGVKFARISMLFALVLVLNGCAVKFVYNQLDWLIPWYLDDYMEMEGDQEALFENRLQAYLAWHRSTQLPLYADFLEDVATRAEKQLNEQDIQFIQTQTETLADAMIRRLIPDMVDVFATASDEQIAELFEKFEDDNATFRKDYIEAGEEVQRKQRQKEVLRYAQRWTGKLSKSQVALVKEWSEKFELMGQELQDSRMVWQEEFSRVLSMRKGDPGYAKAFEKLVLNPGFGRTDVLQTKLDRNADLLIQLYKALDESLSDKQRKRMVQKLRNYAEDFQQLSGQNEP